MRHPTATSALTLAAVLAAGGLAALVNTRVLDSAEGRATPTNRVELVETRPEAWRLPDRRVIGHSPSAPPASAATTSPSTTPASGAGSVPSTAPAAIPDVLAAPSDRAGRPAPTGPASTATAGASEDTASRHRPPTPSTTTERPKNTPSTSTTTVASTSPTDSTAPTVNSTPTTWPRHPPPRSPSRPTWPDD